MTKPTIQELTEPRTDANLEFCLRLTRAYFTLERRIDNALASLHGLSFSDFTILYHLDRAPGSRLRRIDLAERVSMTASGVTRSLLPLEKLGLITREADPRDARVAYAMLTDTGKALFENALASVRPVTAEIIRELQPSQMDELSGWLAQLAGINLSNA